MKCGEEGCNGEIDTSVSIPLQTDFNSFSIGHPCGNCGRIHWPDGDPAINHRLEKPYWEDEEVVLRDGEGQLVF